MLRHTLLPQVMSPTGSTFLKSSTFIPQSSRAQTPMPSTTLTTIAMSQPLLRSSTSRSEMCSLRHCFPGERSRSRSETNLSSLINRSQSVSERPGRPLLGQTQNQKSSQELDDDRFRTILETQRDQLLSEAKSEVLKHENQTGIAQNYIRELKNQVEFQDMDISRALEGCAHSRRQKDLLHEELAAPKRVLRDTQIRGIHDSEALRRVQELRIDEFSKKGK